MLRSLVFTAFLTCFFASCSHLPGKNENSKNAIARVNEKYLYVNDIQGIIPAGTSVNDSIEITTAYINNWVRQELLLKQAEDNLNEEHRDFNRLIEQYRNSLIIYAYESELVNQKLDTVVPMSEIAEYYNKNQENFRLRENIVLADYVVVNKESAAVTKIKSLLQSTRDGDKEKLITLCQENGADFKFSDGTWQSFGSLTRKIPLGVDDQQDFLNRNKYYEVKDSTTLYLVAIKAYKTKESISPLDFEIENIRTILLNKRKADMLSRMEEDLFNEAVKQNKYEIFKK